MRRGAFTLVEALLALALIAMLGGSLMGFLSEVSNRRRAIDRVSRDEEGVEVVSEQLEASLLCAAAGDVGLGPGIKGDANGVRVVTMGVRAPRAEDRGKGFGAARVIEFSFDAGAGVIRARRWSPGEATPEMETVVEHVRQARWRYHDGTAWVDSFDSVASKGLPGAVELAIWYGEPKKDEEGERSSKGEQVEPAPDHVKVIVVPDGAVGEAKGEGP